MTEIDMLQCSFIKPNLNYDSLTVCKEYNIVNPFALKVFNQQNNKIYTEIYAHVQNLKPYYNYSSKFNSFYGKDWIFIVGILMLFGLTYIKNQFPQVIKKLVVSIYNFQFARQIVDEKSGIMQKSSWLLLSLYIFIVSFLIYALILYFNPLLESEKFLYLFVFAYVLAYYLFKVILYLSLGYFTDTLNQTRLVLSHFSVYYRNMTLFFAPLSVILYFVRIDYFKYFLLFILVVFLVLSLLRIYRGIFLTVQMRFSYLFIFLYLCAIEIIPLMYSYKIITSWV